MPAYDAPEWILPVFITVIALGFPVALVLAWAFELTPEGIKRDSVSPPLLGKLWIMSAMELFLDKIDETPDCPSPWNLCCRGTGLHLAPAAQTHRIAGFTVTGLAIYRFCCIRPRILRGENSLH
jgi:hypothetical protein